MHFRRILQITLFAVGMLRESAFAAPIRSRNNGGPELGVFRALYPYFEVQVNRVVDVLQVRHTKTSMSWVWWMGPKAEM